MAMHEARASGRPIADRGNNHHADVSCQFAAMPVSVGEARRVFSATLGAWSLTDHVDTGRLLVSELATNSVVHAESVFEVRILRILGDQLPEDLVRAQIVMLLPQFFGLLQRLRRKRNRK